MHCKFPPALNIPVPFYLLPFLLNPIPLSPSPLCMEISENMEPASEAESDDSEEADAEFFAEQFRRVPRHRRREFKFEVIDILRKYLPE